MNLQHGDSYRMPDGKVYRARMDYRRYTSALAWTFVPIKCNVDEILFLEDGRIFHLDFSGPQPSCIDTGWQPGDLTPLPGAIGQDARRSG